MKKRLIIILCIISLVSCTAFISSRTAIVHKSKRMLCTVDLENTDLSLIDYAYSQDFLRYGPGYEIALFSTGALQWNPPESWTTLDEMVSFEQLAGKLGVPIHSNAVTALTPDAVIASAYCFIDNRAAPAFEQQDYYIAFCHSPNNSSAEILIYRGHHLYGL